VIRDRNGLHALIEDPWEQIGQTDGTIEQAVRGMQVKVRKLGHRRLLARLYRCSDSITQTMNSTAVLEDPGAPSKTRGCPQSQPQVVHTDSSTAATRRYRHKGLTEPDLRGGFRRHRRLYAYEP